MRQKTGPWSRRIGWALGSRGVAELEEIAVEQPQFVFEVPQGWFERHYFHPGMAVRTERGSLRETFFRR